MTRISYTFDGKVAEFDSAGYEVEARPKLGWFSRDAARCVATEDGEWDGNNMISRATGSQWCHENLLKSAGGVYIIERDNADGRVGQTVGLSYHYASPTKAEEWLRSQNRHVVADREFAPAEERGPGRPAVGSAINVTLPAADLAEVDRIADEDGESRSAVIRAAVSRFLLTR